MFMMSSDKQGESGKYGIRVYPEQDSFEVFILGCNAAGINWGDMRIKVVQKYLCILDRNRLSLKGKFYLYIGKGVLPIPRGEL